MTHTLCVLILLAFLFGPVLVIACCMAAQKEPEFNIFGGGGDAGKGIHDPASEVTSGSELRASASHWVDGPPLPTNFGNKPMEGRVAMELQDRIENHKL